MKDSTSTLGGDLRKLKDIIHNSPIIDNHAHNILLTSELETHRLESITSEASGDALTQASSSLAHLRAIKQLKYLYEDHTEDSEWNWARFLDIRQKWVKDKPDVLASKCLNGTYCILMDDGLGPRQKLQSLKWHDQFTTEPTMQILRIETAAEDIIGTLLQKSWIEESTKSASVDAMWIEFNSQFTDILKSAIKDPTVAGFKSVVCYRSGLDVASLGHRLSKAKTSFGDHIMMCIENGNSRIHRRKEFNDYLVHMTLQILSTSSPKLPKPIQFHTGLGDSDIVLLRSNPAYLQPLIENYPKVPFVLLHSAYPYTREAGYLASIYSNVYLDLGEVFPMLSRCGQISVLRQALELVPYAKLLWSTDGHHFLETFWLANNQFRHALEEVLVEYVQRGDISEDDAIAATLGILFNNANELYGLGFPIRSGNEPMSSINPESKVSKVSSNDDLALWETFICKCQTRFISVQWLDYMGTMRCMLYPKVQFTKLLETKSKIRISRGNLGTLQNDGLTPVVDTTGQISIKPDLRSLKPAQSRSAAPMATVMSSMKDETGILGIICPRSRLESMLQQISEEHSIHLLIGFEIEVTFLRRNDASKIDSPDDLYRPFDTTHAWGSMSSEQWDHSLALLTDIADLLAEMGIMIQKFHSESGQGQYEFVLPPEEPLKAIDMLYQTRQAIQQIAEQKGVRATFHPCPFPGVGNGSHAHISLNSTSLSDPSLDMVEESFWGGVLEHLEALCSICLPEHESYNRVSENSWTGGVYIAWGTQNRETPLRKVEKRRWEVRCLDGFANMYLSMAGIVAAGLLGLTEQRKLSVVDCPHNPSKLSDSERKEIFGITKRLPQTLRAALQAMSRDKTLSDLLGENMIQSFIQMKHSESEMLNGMSELERKKWFIERY